MENDILKSRGAIDHDPSGAPRTGPLKFKYQGFQGDKNGDLISKKYGKNLVKCYRDQYAPEDLGNVAVVFDAEPLLLVLSQPECRAIRFYFAKTRDIYKEGKNTKGGEETLVMVGVDKDGHDLGTGPSKNNRKNKRIKSIFGPDLSLSTNSPVSEQISMIMYANSAGETDDGNGEENLEETIVVQVGGGNGLADSQD